MTFMITLWSFFWQAHFREHPFQAVHRAGTLGDLNGFISDSRPCLLEGLLFSTVSEQATLPSFGDSWGWCDKIISSRCGSAICTTRSSPFLSIFCRSIRLDYLFVCQHDALSRITLLFACNCHLARLLDAFPSFARPLSTSRGKLDCSIGIAFSKRMIFYQCTFRTSWMSVIYTNAAIRPSTIFFYPA